MSELQAGRELDELIAQKVTGWKWVHCIPICTEFAQDITLTIKGDNWAMLLPPEDAARYKSGAISEEKPYGARENTRLPRYSTDISAAWQVVDKMRAAGIEVIIGCFGDMYSIELRKWEDRRDYGIPGDPHTHRTRITFYCRTGLESLPDGICHAALDPVALKALGASAE